MKRLLDGSFVFKSNYVGTTLKCLVFFFFLFANMYYINVTQKKRGQSPVIEVKPSVKKRERKQKCFYSVQTSGWGKTMHLCSLGSSGTYLTSSLRKEERNHPTINIVSV